MTAYPLPAPIPRYLDVGAQRFSIDSTDTTTQRLEEDGKLGDTRVDSLIINLRNNRPHTAIGETLVHECLHAAWWDGGIDKLGADISKAEEGIVTLLAPRLLAMLRDNPDLVEFITAGAPPPRDDVPF